MAGSDGLVPSRQSRHVSIGRSRHRAAQRRERAQHRRADGEQHEGGQGADDEWERQLHGQGPGVAFGVSASVGTHIRGEAVEDRFDREAEPVDSTRLQEWVLSEQPTAEEAVAMADEVEAVLRDLV